MHEWLAQALDRLAGAAGISPDELELGPTDVEELLELARVAAHESGERTNAPLLCYLVGLAHGRKGGELAHLIDATARSG